MAYEPITVLLLEDDPDVYEATRFILEEEGFRVLSAGDLDSAERLALEVRRCVVLLDLSLPGDPHRFVRTLRESATFEGQVLLFSAGDQLAERARSLGADGVVAKPFEVDALVAELRARAEVRPALSAVDWH